MSLVEAVVLHALAVVVFVDVTLPFTAVFELAAVTVVAAVVVVVMVGIGSFTEAISSKVFVPLFIALFSLSLESPVSILLLSGYLDPNKSFPTCIIFSN